MLDNSADYWYNKIEKIQGGNAEKMRGTSMGGRGSAGGGSRGGATITRLESKIEGYKKKLADMTSKYNTWELPKEYYRTQRQRQNAEEKLRNLRAKAPTTPANSVKSDGKTFVNSFGEATKREITSSTYERARKRQQREVESFLGVKKK